MRWQYLTIAIASMGLILLGIILGYLSVLTSTQSFVTEMVGWVMLLALSIARVIETKKKK